jgi:competence protein ComEC
MPVLLCLLGCSAGLGATVHALATFTRGVDQISSCERVSCAYTGVIAEPVDTRADEDVYRVSLQSINGGAVLVPVAVYVVQHRHSTFDVDDVVTFSGTVQAPSDFVSETGRVVSYARMLRARGVHGTVKYPHVERTGHGRTIHGALMRFGQDATKKIDELFVEPSSGLAKGILFGTQHALDPKTDTAFRHSGLSHITVLSGANIAIVSSFVFSALFMFSFIFRGVITIGAVVCFVIATGAAAPSLRAGVMGVVVLMAKIVGKQAQGLDVFVVAVLAIALWSPLSLCADVSLQLSLLATYAVIVVAPVLSQWWYPRVPEVVREVCATTSAALIVVSPWVLFVFGTTSVSAPITNLLVVPLVPVVMMCTVAALLTSWVLPPLGSIMAMPADVLLRFIIAVARTSDTYVSMIVLPPFSIVWVFVAYLILYVWFRHVQKRYT